MGNLDVGVTFNCVGIIALGKEETKFSLLLTVSCIFGFLVFAREIQTFPRDSLAQDRPYLVKLKEGEIEDQPAPKTKNGCSSGAETVTYDDMENIILVDKKYLEALLAHTEGECCPSLHIPRIYLDKSGVIYCYIRVRSCRRNKVFCDKIFHSLSVA